MTDCPRFKVTALLFALCCTLACPATQARSANDGNDWAGSYSGFIGVYADSNANFCLIEPQDLVAEFYVILNNTQGIQGAEFRLVGLPPSAVVVEKTAHAGAIELGDPLGLGVNLAFPVCDPGNFIVLYHYRVLLESPQYVSFSIESHYTPSNPTFTCPHVVLCDAPVFTKSCVREGHTGGEIGVGPTDPSPADGATGVPPNTLLSWVGGTISNCSHGADTAVYLGTDPNPPYVGGSGNPFGYSGPFDPGPLLPNTLYYWRVVVYSNGSVSSPLWTFTTGSTVPVESTSWNAVKRLYR